MTLLTYRPQAFRSNSSHFAAVTCHVSCDQLQLQTYLISPALPLKAFLKSTSMELFHVMKRQRF